MNLKACVVIGCLLPVLTLDSVADSLSDKQINERLKREFAASLCLSRLWRLRQRLALWTTENNTSVSNV